MHIIGLGPFTSGTQRNAYETAFYLLILTEFLILLLSWKNSGGEKKKADRGSRSAIVCGFCVVIFVSFSGIFVRTLPAACSYPGTALLLFGIAFRCWAVWTLRGFFTLSVQTGKEQTLVQNGPYRLIRHPAYTGGILELAGIALGVRSLPGLVCAIIVSAAVYGYRIHTEERALREHFGKIYEEYSKRTWRLFPYVL